MPHTEKTYYHRHLPHYQPTDATFFITFRLSGSLPVETIQRLLRERKENEAFLSGAIGTSQRRDYFEKQRVTYFERFETLLDGTTDGPRWLGEDRIAGIVADAVHFRDKEEYDLLAFCIMPNHVHMVVTVGQRNSSPYNAETKKLEYPLTSILENLKWFTAIQCNKVLNRKGQFWQHESYDHVIRDGEELERTLWYVMNNPVNARLVDSREQWQWSYCKPGLLE